MWPTIGVGSAGGVRTARARDREHDDGVTAAAT
jgi:hypothetical protein